jgi:hypothetical protein
MEHGTALWRGISVQRSLEDARIPFFEHPLDQSRVGVVIRRVGWRGCGRAYGRNAGRVDEAIFSCKVRLLVHGSSSLGWETNKPHQWQGL